MKPLILTFSYYLQRAIAMTAQKRQKELKRQEKQRAKSEERRNKKIAKRAEEHHGPVSADESTHTTSVTDVDGHDIENPT
jgi:hypothetical protein